MIRLNISFTDKDAKRLASERKETETSTSALIRKLVENHFAEKDRKAVKEKRNETRT